MNWNVKIKELREKLYLTQNELANLLGVAFISVNRYENNKSIPTMKIKRKLKKLFDENNIYLEDD